MTKQGTASEIARRYAKEAEQQLRLTSLDRSLEAARSSGFADPDAVIKGAAKFYKWLKGSKR